VICSKPTPYIKAVKGNTLPVFKGVDYTGHSFENWTVLGPINCGLRTNGNNYRTKWLCQCACGSDPVWVTKENLCRGYSKGCLKCCGNRNRSNNNGNWKGYGEIPGEVLNKIRTGATTRNIAIEVTLVDLDNLWKIQNRKCALTGLLLVMGDTASLDRIDSNAPYSINNIQWVHKVVNIMKNAFSEEVFIDMCCKVVKHKQSSNRY
jgi:hypothetical protein